MMLKKTNEEAAEIFHRKSSASFPETLRTKKIQGAEGMWESSVNMDIRIIWFYENNEIILLLDIGHHDILNKF